MLWSRAALVVVVSRAFESNDNEEVLMLPEVMSKLDFSPRDHAEPGNLQSELSLREAAHWGRLYVDGWPQPIQYLRAHFGQGVPSQQRLPMILSDPWDACGYQRRAAEMRQEETIVLAARGTCTFGTKAKAVAESTLGKGTLVIVNNEPGIIHAPGPDAHDVEVGVVMISQADGEQLVDHLRRRPRAAVNGTFVPVNCIDHSETRKAGNSLCEVATTTDRDFVATVLDSGFLRVKESTVEFLLATFGTAVPFGGLGEPDVLNVRLRAAVPFNACADDLALPEKGEWLVVRRGGGCSFFEKAMNAQTAGALGVVISNAHADDELVRPSCSPRWVGANITIPVLLAPSSVGDQLALDTTLQAQLVSS